MDLHLIVEALTVTEFIMKAEFRSNQTLTQTTVCLAEIYDSSVNRQKVLESFTSAEVATL